MECKVEGVPLPDLVWYKDGEKIVPSDRIRMELDGDGSARLIISPCNVDDEGVPREAFDAYRAPRLIVPLESVKVPETGRLLLSCQFSGDPRPTIRWFKDGEHNMGRFDGGGYRCVAENEYGSARTTCEVNVQLPLTMKRVKQGEEAILECVPYGKPFPAIKWLKDGIEIFEDVNLKIESVEDGTQRLTIKQAEFCSEGYYRCVATNEFGTASTKGELVVEGDRTIRAKKVEDEKAEPVECKPRIRRGLYNM
uniref:Ig-like domain-containing protein n=1 Tax=Parascaris equorum TaxID=6256 RepID=A0A914RQ82_PAREQ